MSTAPQAYKFCDAHMKPSYGQNRCMQCFPLIPGEIEPPPPVRPQGSQSEQAQAQPAIPQIQDPRAQKIVQAAQDYALAVDAVAVIEKQVADAKEALAAFEKKLTETREMAENAQNQLREAAGGK